MVNRNASIIMEIMKQIKNLKHVIQPVMNYKQYIDVDNEEIVMKM